MKLQGHYITKEGKRVNFRTVYYIDTIFGRMHNQEAQTLCLSDKNIIKLVLPDDIKQVFCRRNFITELVIPQSVNYILCDMMDGIEEQYRKDLYLDIWQATT